MSILTIILTTSISTILIYNIIFCIIYNIANSDNYYINFGKGIIYLVKKLIINPILYIILYFKCKSYNVYKFYEIIFDEEKERKKYGDFCEEHILHKKDFKYCLKKEDGHKCWVEYSQPFKPSEAHLFRQFFVSHAELQNQYSRFCKNNNIELLSRHKIQRDVSNNKPKLDQFKFSRNGEEK